MRDKALPYLLPALQALPPLLAELFAELGLETPRRRAQARFLRQVLPAIRYTELMLAPYLQAQLSPWLRELAADPALAAQVTRRLARESPAPVQEALLWAFAFETGGRLSAGSGGQTRDLQALFVPLVWEAPDRCPTLAPVLAESLAERLHGRGLLHPDEVVLVAPPCLPPQALTSLDELAVLVDFALAGALSAWGDETSPAPDLKRRWQAWWQAPHARRGAASTRPLEPRFALLVAVSPEPSTRVLDELMPWQEEARTGLLLSDRFDPASLAEYDSETELEAHAESALEGWVDLVNGRLEDAGSTVVVAGPPSDAYTACGRGAVEVGCRFLLDLDEEDEEAPVFLIANGEGLAVELGGAGLRLPWAPAGALMPAMLPPLEEVMHAASGRRLERATASDLNRLVLIAQNV